MVEWKKIQVDPEKPTPNLVFVTNVSPNSTEKSVRDFFRFCSGKIREMELAKDPGSDNQVGLLDFEKESDAAIVVELTNAVVDEQTVTFKPVFKDLPFFSNKAENQEESGSAAREEKPKTSVVIELLAAGYMLTEHIIKLAHEFDGRCGVSSRVQFLLEQVKAELAKLDGKYKVCEKAEEIDARFHLRSTANSAYQTATEYGAQALQSGLGQTMYDMYSQARFKVMEVHNQSRELAQKKLSSSASGSPLKEAIDSISTAASRAASIITNDQCPPT